MTPLRSTVAAAVLLLPLSAGAAPTAADETQPLLGDRARTSGERARGRRAAPSDWRMNAGLGVFSGHTLEGGPAGSLFTSYRWKHIEGGLLLEGGNSIWEGTYYMLAGAVGPVYQMPGGVRLELLGIVGSNAYEKHGCGLFCRSSSGGSGTLPWAGVRAGGSYLFGRSQRGHFELGGAVTYGSDLDRVRVDTTTYEDGFFGSDGFESRTHTLGGSRGSVMLVLGAAVDIGG